MIERWKIKPQNSVSDEYKIIAEPKFEELHNYVMKAYEELTYKINQAEEQLLLESMDTSSLIKLKKLVQNELEKRDIYGKQISSR